MQSFLPSCAPTYLQTFTPAVLKTLRRLAVPPIIQHQIRVSTPWTKREPLSPCLHHPAGRRRALSLDVHVNGGGGFGARKCPVTARLVVLQEEQRRGESEPWCATETPSKFKRTGEKD